MNKIYKVIWNKAKGCYQVASEFAHQQGRGGSTKSAVKHTAAVLTVMALLGGISGMNIVSAADQGDTVTAGQATIKGDTNNNFVVSGHGGGAVDDVTSAGNSIIISALGDTQNNGTPTTVKNTNETIAIGNGVQVTVSDTIHNDNTMNYLYNANTVIGTHAKALDSAEGLALGSEASLNNVQFGIAMGYGAKVDNQKDINFGGIALGYQAAVNDAKNGIALGTQTKVNDARGIALGAQAQVNSQSGIAFGSGASVESDADRSIALGSGSLATEADTVSVGSVGGYYRRIVNVQDGKFTEGSHDAVTAGQLYAAGMVPGTIEAKQGDTAKNSIAMGEKSKVMGNNSIAIGGQALSSADVVMGQDATATHVNATAIGNNSHATADQATALGQNACATAEGAVALGNNSVANEKNTVSVGNKGSERKIVNVADGTVAENSTDAVTGGQLYGVKEDVDELNNSAVKYDNADKTSVTFGGTNGTALKNVSDIYSSTGKGHIYFYGDNVHIGADNSNNGVNVTTDGAAVQGNLNVTGNFSVGDDPKSGTGFAFDQTNGLSSAFYGSTTKDGITERNQSFLKQNDDGITLSYKHQTDSDATGNITDADNTFTFGKDGVKLSGQNGAALKITGVADGTEATDAVNFGQLTSKITDATKNSVQYDNADKSSVTFKGENGTTLKNVSAIEGVGGSKLTMNQYGAGLYFGDYQITATNHGAGIRVINSDGNSTSSIMVSKDKGVTVSGGLDVTGSVISNVADGKNTSDAVNKGQLDAVSDKVSSLDKDSVKWDKDDKGNTTNKINGVGLKDGTVTADKISVGDKFKVDKDGNVTTGNLEVNGTFKVNGSEIATKGDITDISGAIKDVNSRVDVTNKIVGDGKLDNGADNLTAGINKNSASITTINCQIGATGEKGALKLTNGATTIESGINQNTAAIQQNSEAINSLGRGLNHLGQEVDNVGAISAALAGLHPLGYDGDGSKFQIAAAVGTYDGTQAAALGGFYHFNRDVMMSLGASSSFGSDNKTAANLGVTFRVGQGSGDRKIADSSTMDTILQRLEKLDKEVAGLKEENKKLTQENEQQKQELEALKR